MRRQATPAKLTNFVGRLLLKRALKPISDDHFRRRLRADGIDFRLHLLCALVRPVELAGHFIHYRQVQRLTQQRRNLLRQLVSLSQHRAVPACCRIWLRDRLAVSAAEVCITEIRETRSLGFSPVGAPGWQSWLEAALQCTEVCTLAVHCSQCAIHDTQRVGCTGSGSHIQVCSCYCRAGPTQMYLMLRHLPQ